MKKFSLIQEGDDKFKLGNFVVTEKEFIEYQNKIMYQLRKFYKNKVDIDGISFIASQPFDAPNRVKSIINYANSNMMLCEWIVENFKIRSKLDLINFIESESENLFTEEGKYFERVIEILLKTEENGIKNEEMGAEFLAKVIDKKLNKDIKVFRTEKDCKDDLFFGIDLYFLLDGKKYTCQVKPLKDYELIGDTYTITSSGKLKSYDVHYMMFVNRYRNKCVLFKNKGIKINGKTITVNIENFVA